VLFRSVSVTVGVGAASRPAVQDGKAPSAK
jgi:hypothetical protein